MAHVSDMARDCDRVVETRRLAVNARGDANERWSMNSVSARLLDGRWFRTLTVPLFLD
jgi:hypothetical protein